MNYPVTKKLIGKFKLETLKNIWIDEFFCLRSKAHSFNCKLIMKVKNKLKGILKCQSKHIKFEGKKLYGWRRLSKSM